MKTWTWKHLVWMSNQMFKFFDMLFKSTKIEITHVLKKRTWEFSQGLEQKPDTKKIRNKNFNNKLRKKKCWKIIIMFFGDRNSLTSTSLIKVFHNEVTKRVMFVGCKKRLPVSLIEDAWTKSETSIFDAIFTKAVSSHAASGHYCHEFDWSCGVNCPLCLSQSSRFAPTPHLFEMTKSLRCFRISTKSSDFYEYFEFWKLTLVSEFTFYSTDFRCDAAISENKVLWKSRTPSRNLDIWR